MTGRPFLQETPNSSKHLPSAGGISAEGARIPKKMTENRGRQPAILMIAYTNYETDPRVIRAAEAAADAGFSVDCLTLARTGQSAEQTIHGVRVIRLPQKRYRGRSRVGYLLAYLEFFCRCFVASTRLHGSRRYDVIHVNNMPDVLVFSVIIPRLLGAKVILDIHDPMPETFNAKYATGGRNPSYAALLYLERASVAFATRTLTVNHPVRDGILLKHGYSQGAIDVVANFADERLFKPIAYPPIDQCVRFVFHGTILERYGFRTLVDAVAKMRRRHLIKVRIIGEGDFSAGLRLLIESNGVADTIEFVNRVYPVQEIPTLLEDCHVGLVPLDITPISNFALPLKLIEYTCLGLPSVTVISTAISYYFRSDECLLYRPGDSSGLAAILDGIAEDPSRLEPYRQQLLAARTRMSWAKEKERYVDILRQLSRTAPVVSSKKRVAV
jgi:glycosyltransferase involved in cell wall biosynthesis